MNRKLFEFIKISAAPPQEKLDDHFGSMDSKKWSRFKRDLRSKRFVEAVKQDDRADEKLKRFAEMNHLHKTGKGPSFSMPSESSGKKYTIKYHEGIDRYSCSCPDWAMIRSSRGGDCKHVSKLRSQLSMVKEASVAIRELAGLGRLGLRFMQTESDKEQAWHAGQINQGYRALAKEKKLRRG